MKEYSVEEIIKFAQRIEEESYKFYKEANGRFNDEEIKKLTDELARAEVDHLNRLRKLLKEAHLSENDLKKRIKLEDTGYDKIVQAAKIPDNSSIKDVLETALERETSTANTYRILNTFTNLPDEIIDVFDYLTAQEEGHVKIIENKLKKLK
ncbi:MAG: ferritin family protein [Spirochaetales bacterium]|nr:ferritin family protein [Spirochaetales bacterium]